MRDLLLLAVAAVVLGLVTGEPHQIKCPICSEVTDLNKCASGIHCYGNNFCMGVVSNWKYTTSCEPIFDQVSCANQQFANPPACLSGGKFGPHDNCTFCCSEDDCVDAMFDHVRVGIGNAPAVIHCPLCSNVTDPEQCFNNTAACPAGSDTCEISVEYNRVSSSCSVESLCQADPSTHCCHENSCIYHYLTSATTTPPPPSTQPASTLPTTTAHPTTTLPACRDAGTFPCSGQVCSDRDLGSRYCALTCGHCQAPTTPPHPTHASCDDLGVFACDVSSFACQDADISHRYCRKTCGLCP